jgi:hypothetical protein
MCLIDEEIAKHPAARERGGRENTPDDGKCVTHRVAMQKLSFSIF